MERQLPKYNSEYFFEKKNKYALLIPTLNEGERIQSQLRKIKSLSLENTVDIFILDSNSTDKSLEKDLRMRQANFAFPAKAQPSGDKNNPYLWPGSKCWIRAVRVSIQHAATKVTNIDSFISRWRLLCLRQITIHNYSLFLGMVSHL